MSVTQEDLEQYKEGDEIEVTLNDHEEIMLQFRERMFPCFFVSVGRMTGIHPNPDGDTVALRATTPHDTNAPVPGPVHYAFPLEFIESVERPAAEVSQ